MDLLLPTKTHVCLYLYIFAIYKSGEKTNKNNKLFEKLACFLDFLLFISFSLPRRPPEWINQSQSLKKQIKF